MITIGLWTTEESCPSDSSTTVIMLNNFSHREIEVILLNTDAGSDCSYPSWEVYREVT